MLQTPAVILPRRSHNLDPMQWCSNWFLDVTSPLAYLLRHSIGSSTKPGPSHEAHDSENTRKTASPITSPYSRSPQPRVYQALSGYHKAASRARPHTKPQAAATRTWGADDALLSFLRIAYLDECVVSGVYCECGEYW